MENQEMAKYILSTVMGSGAIYGSWGVSKRYAIKNGLRLKVQGFKHKGFVDVIYNEGADLFDVKIVSLKEVILKELTGIYINELSETIDNEIENCKDYEKRVEEFFNKTIFG